MRRQTQSSFLPTWPANRLTVGIQHLRICLTFSTGAFDDEDGVLQIPLDELLNELRSNVPDVEQDIFDYRGELSEPSDVEEDEGASLSDTLKDEGLKKRVCVPALHIP